NYVPDLQNNPEMFAFLQRYASMGMTSVLIFWLVGLVVTMIIQSSAATFAICLVMFSKGWIDFELACAIVLGSAIGTTITPILASMSGNVAAKRTAMGHLLFNVFGAIWCLVLFVPFVNVIIDLCGAVGEGNPNNLYQFVANLQVTDPEVYNNLFNNALPLDHPAQSRISAASSQLVAMQVSASIGLSIFYTVYKFINLSIMIWFTKLYVKMVEWLIPSRKKTDDEFQLKFISGGLLSSSELNITQAQKEMVVYADRVNRMISMAKQLVHTKEKSDEFNHLFSRLEKYEEISDRMELEIANFLNKVAEGRLSNAGKRHIAAMLSIVSEIESIADSCYNIGRSLVRKQQTSVEFNDTIYKNIDSMFDQVEPAMSALIKLLANVESVTQPEIMASYNKEREINNLRNQLRSGNVENIKDHVYEYQAGIFYMDIVSDLEKTGDYIVNVVDTVKEQYMKP
ncbi:MAG: Na/Pi symporter, partial [Muribaculaceae bacterium]|nr:Na/Pi symporter [Muribaculaceae bacterium]